MKKKVAVIIGAGPAGLTAAYELINRTEIHPIVIEKSTYMGGISRTVQYKGNRMDLGGHRFFSKSERVMDWWLQHMPLGSVPQVDTAGDNVMLVRERKSRIYFLRRFFSYPIQLSRETLANLGLIRTLRIGLSYLRARIFPIKKVENLEQFFIHRFGQELYRTFFKSYTEKVWGTCCDQISAAWGEQRIKSLSVGKALAHGMKNLLGLTSREVSQKDVETSLIERFLYPKYGPGQLWEEVARKVVAGGGTILTEADVVGIHSQANRVHAVEVRSGETETTCISGDYFLSTMPIKQLVEGLGEDVPRDAREIADGLIYRDFLTVGLLVRRLTVSDREQRDKLIKDNWIYLQDPEIAAGRLQIFNNWSPHLVADSDRVWLGVEYFCNESDELWRRPDFELGQLAGEELQRIGILNKNDILDFTVHRVPKAYPAYFGSYDRFDTLREYLDRFENLFLIGRNGMHRYNNQDHSMLTAMIAVENILDGVTDKANIWAVNTEMEYHEAKCAVRRKIREQEPDAAVAPACTG